MLALPSPSFAPSSDVNKPDIEWLQSNAGMLYESQARRISLGQREERRKAVVFGPGKYIGQREPSAMGITFCQIPGQSHLKFTGPSLRRKPESKGRRMKTTTWRLPISGTGYRLSPV